MSRTVPREIAGHDCRVWPEEVVRSGWAARFGLSRRAPRPLVVDVGFGGGEFLTELARRDPDALFVGLEGSFKRVLKLARRLSRSDLRNVRLMAIDAAWAVDHSFEDESVTAFWINFPDPWSKRRHQRRRLVDARFVRRLAQRLIPSGSLHVATDDSEYAQSISRVLEGERRLENVHAPALHRHERPEHAATCYQLTMGASGRCCCFYHYQRTASATSALDTHGCDS